MKMIAAGAVFAKVPAVVSPAAISLSAKPEDRKGSQLQLIQLLRLRFGAMVFSTSNASVRRVWRDCPALYIEMTKAFGDTNSFAEETQMRLIVHGQQPSDSPSWKSSSSGARTSSASMLRPIKENPTR